MEPTLLLAADVGGTKTCLGLFGDDPAAPLREAVVATRAYPSLAALLEDFLGADRARVRRAALGVAGPVEGGCVAPTNLPWDACEGDLAATLALPDVRLLNDLAATAWGLALVAPDHLVTLQEGAEDPDAPKALLAPGTGLGEALLLPGGAVLSSEGGHADYAPANEEEYALHRFLAARYGHVSWERVASGLGLRDLLEFQEASGRAVGTEIERRLSAEDPAAVIADQALAQGDPACRGAFGLFLRALGAEAGNLALKALPFGGLYLCGGIPAKTLPLLRQGGFLEAFLAKGRLRPLLERIPVRVVTEPRVALWGAARYGMSFPRK